MSSNIILSINDPIKVIKDRITGIKYRLSLNGLGSSALGISRIIDVNYTLSNGKYLVGNSNDFLCLMNQGDSNYYNVLNTTVPNFKTGNFLQTSNIDLGLTINPIMFETFSGIYDGNNRELRNINIVRDSVNNSIINMGLFNSLSNAIVKNVKITGTTSIVNSSSNVAGCDFGFIAGYSLNSIIQDCIVSPVLSNVKCMNFGGIVKDSINSTIIRNNFNAKGSINTNKDYCGGIVASATDSKILFNTNSMIGDFQSSNNVVGGIYGGNSNGGNYVYGNLNIMKGNINAFGTCGSIQGITGVNDSIQVNINAMYGNLISSNTNNGGIIGDANIVSTIKYNINSQSGNINGSGIVDSVGIDTIVQKNLNVMKGNCSQAGGIKNISSFDSSKIGNNLIMIRGDSLVKEASSSDAIAFTGYGFSNSSQILSTDNVLKVLASNNYYKYYSNSNYSNLPILNFDVVKTVNIESNVYNGPAPYWGVYFPNVASKKSYIFSSNNIYQPAEITNSTNSWIVINEF